MKNVLVGMINQNSLLSTRILIWSSISHENRQKTDASTIQLQKVNLDNTS